MQTHAKLAGSICYDVNVLISWNAICINEVELELLLEQVELISCKLTQWPGPQRGWDHIYCVSARMCQDTDPHDHRLQLNLGQESQNILHFYKCYSKHKLTIA